jgi:hypothetical protein
MSTIKPGILRNKAPARLRFEQVPVEILDEFGIAESGQQK